MKRQCPRRGMVGIGNKTGMQLFETTCNTWRCPYCKVKLLNLVTDKMAYGISMIERLEFITLTVATTNSEILNQVPGGSAAYVKDKWARLLRSISHRLHLKQSQIPWFRVVELTKQEMPHLHLLMAIPSFLTTCRVNERKSQAWLAQDCGSCIEHLVAGSWYQLTGSYIFDVTDVYSTGAAKYMVKEYLGKGFYNFELMNWHGFQRRYTYSRAWPRIPRMRLIGTILKSWDVVQYKTMKDFDRDLIKDYPVGGGLFDRIGPSYAEALANLKQQRRTIGVVKSVSNI